ncbi:MAG: TIR domain-containing protein [Hyphomicrobiaceae bacterium]
METESVTPDRIAFIVHGHDEGARQSVARFLEKIDVILVILNEQTMRGRTILEKFEHHADVGFAIVLLTPDDIGSTGDSGEFKNRARQNVVLECGFFLAKLGRENVCVMRRGDVEIPSDLIGLGYIDYDAADGWQMKLAQEIYAAGIDVNFNKLMKG